MEKITVKSYAKINLFLEVKGKRPDGYHNIRTLFQTIDLADRVHIERAGKGIELFCNKPEVPQDSGNLAYKAAELFFEQAGIKTGLKIRIVKNIPVTAGLAGGSSNAAAVLNGCNKLFGCNFPEKTLSKMALQLGSDVPFLLKGGTQLGEGRGELLKELLPPLTNIWLVLIVKGQKSSTGSVFRAYKYSSTKSGIFDKTFKEFFALTGQSGGDIAKVLYNELELPAGKLFPEIITVKEDLRKAGALGTLMSGSGPAVFGIAGSKTAAETIERKLKNRYNRIFLTKTVKPAAIGGF